MGEKERACDDIQKAISLLGRKALRDPFVLYELNIRSEICNKVENKKTN